MDEYKEYVGRKVKLLRPVRDHDGKSRFKEENPTVLRIMNNLDRVMFLIQFQDGVTTFMFPSEVILEEKEE